MDFGDGDYEVVFQGETFPGANVGAVKAALGRLFDQAPAAIEHLFAAGEVVIKNDLSREAAERYQAEMSRCGAVARIRRMPGRDPTREIPSIGKASFRGPLSQELSLADVKAALMECPRCGHRQLEGDYCTQCNVDIKAFRLEERRRAKEDRIIEARIRELRQGGPESAGPNEPVDTEPQAAPAPVAAAEEPDPVRYAGFWLRSGALAIDVAIAAIVPAAMYLVAGDRIEAWAGAHLSAASPAGIAAAWWLTALVALLSMFAACWGAMAASPGQVLLGMQIMNDAARPAHPLRLMWRWWMLLVCVLTIVGLLLPLFEPRKRALHDVFAGTVVVRR